MFEILFAVLLLFVACELYATLYFRSEKFIQIKKSIEAHTFNCNELNEHIEELKQSYVDINSIDYGTGQLSDNSNYKMKRRAWASETKTHLTHNCSASVCKNASNQPFKYLCKYFDIKSNEETLSKFERVLNNFLAAEQGKFLLKGERDSIVASISNSIPGIILFLKRERVIQELGFDAIDLSDLYFPTFTFQYVSAGGNSSSRCDIKLDTQNMEKFVAYMSTLVKFKNSIAGQRALMTSALRERIKIRDGFSCRICKISAVDTNNLLLEIDHIVPLSKGGMTTETNLQTLCWKCNRSKGAKIFPVE